VLTCFRFSVRLFFYISQLLHVVTIFYRCFRDRENCLIVVFLSLVSVVLCLYIVVEEACTKRVSFL